MPLVEMVEYEDAVGLVKDVYDDILDSRGIKAVPNFWKTIASHPQNLARTWQSLKEVMGPGHLNPLTKELIAIAVSATNNCEYCIHSHTAAARKLGLDDEMLGELLAVVGMFNETNRLANGYQVEVDSVFLKKPA